MQVTLQRHYQRSPVSAFTVALLSSSPLQVKTGFVSIKVVCLTVVVMVSVRVHVRDSTCLKLFSGVALSPVWGS